MTSKRCNICGIVKPLSEYYRQNHRRTRDGHKHYCRDCARASGRASHLARVYSITPGTYAAMLAAQGGVCAICGEAQRLPRLRPVKRAPRANMDALKIDHVTGKVRGLLCELCNAGLGGFRDDVALLAAAIRYLQQYASSALVAAATAAPVATPTLWPDL